MSEKNKIILQKNQICTAKIVDYGSNGEGIAKIDGNVVFVPFTIVGEICEFVIILIKKDFAIGKLLNIINPSPSRVNPPCPYYKKCGGCQLQHIEYSEQLNYKRNYVANCLNKYANVGVSVNNVVKSEKQYGYRNKFAFPVQEVDGKMVVGMYKTASHNLVQIDDCLLQEDCKYIIDCFLDYANKYNLKAYNLVTKKGIKHLVCRTFNDGVLLTIVSTNKLTQIAYLYEILSEKYKLVNIVNNINTKENNVILGDKDYICYGSGQLAVNEFGLTYNINSHSFMQVNNGVKHKLYSAVLDNIYAGDVVVDAYSGAGVLSSIIAKKCKQVYGIEIVKQAVDNANELAKQNNITNLTNICGDCKTELPKLVKELKDFVVVLDPPRKGCDKAVIDALIFALPKKIIYVSCNPATLARDLSYLKEHYNITTIQPYDMFPQTANVETLVVMNIKQ